MKPFNKLLLFVLLSGFIAPAFAQKPIYIGKVSEIAATYKKNAEAMAGNMLSNLQVIHPMPGNKQLALQVTSAKQKGTATYFFGSVYNSKYSNFYLKITGSAVSGAIVMREQKKFYRYSAAGGSVYLTEEDIDKILCIGIPEIGSTSRQDAKSIPQSRPKPASAAVVAAAVPSLQSLPGAGAVLYLDFDGQTVSNTLWNSNFNSGNPIVAAAANLTETEMTEAWKLMSEDFRPFQLNVTTDESVFNSAPVNRRMRVIFTPTNYFYPNAGGVAYVGSFTWGGTSNGETPCWVFNTGIKGAGEAGSHESGHTLGLSHDGRISPQEEYFAGQGSWAPIMGVGYYVPVVQWSKGEYPSANNMEDDLNKITTQNGFGYRTDDHGNDISTATPLVKDANGNVPAVSNKGVISTRTDVDVFSFTTNGSPIGLTVTPDPGYPDLDVLVTLRNAAGTVIATSDPATMEAYVDATPAAGTYYLTVDGTQGALGANSDYASIGSYSIATKDYCTPAYADGCTTYATLVNNFSFNTLVNNNSACGNGTAAGYTNYAPAGALTTSVKKGQSYTMTMQASNYNEYFGVWIDYNGDKDFDDSGEFVYASPATTTSQFSATITIPSTAILGTTRLRVRSNWDPAITSTQSCASFTWGEAEDYTITITGNSAKPTITASGPTSNLCPGTGVTLTSSQASSYVWSTGDTTRSIIVTTGGSYTVTTDGGTSAPAVVSYLACAKPTALTTSNRTSTSIKLNWATVPCGVRYTVRYRPVNTTKWINKKITANTITLTGLQPSTTYQWQVQTICVATPKTASSFVSGTNFTTNASGLIASVSPGSSTKSIGETTINSNFDALVFPNPAKNSATLRISGAANIVSVKITDMAGKILWQSGKANAAQIALPIEKMAAGMYMVTVSDSKQSKILRLVKQ